MAFFRSRSSTTRDLTQAAVVLSVRQAPRRRFVLAGTFVALTLLVGGAFFSDTWQQRPWWPQWVRVALHPEAEKGSVYWQQELDTVRQELAQLRLEQQIEEATRQELERQIAALQEQLKAATLELDFVQSRQPPPATPAATPAARR